MDYLETGWDDVTWIMIYYGSHALTRSGEITPQMAGTQLKQKNNILHTWYPVFIYL
jgi:hypothetical protein